MKKKARANPKRTARTSAQAARREAPFYRPFSKIAPQPSRASSNAAAQEAPEPPKPKSEDLSAATRALETQESFAIYMAGVEALQSKPARIPKTASRVERAPGPVAPADDLDAPARAELHALVIEGVRFEVSDDGERIEGRRIDVEPREVRRLRRALYAVDAKLDLHGMTAGEARRAVEAFVRKRCAEGDHAVLIVHGKGTHSPRGDGVLRGEIAAWLSQGSAARHVAAFASPPADLGGTGAVLVLLAR